MRCVLSEWPLEVEMDSTTLDWHRLRQLHRGPSVLNYDCDAFRRRNKRGVYIFPRSLTDLGAMQTGWPRYLTEPGTPPRQDHLHQSVKGYRSV